MVLAQADFSLNKFINGFYLLLWEPSNWRHVHEYYSIQNKGLVFHNPMLPIVYVCRMSTRSCFFIFRSMHCHKTLITAKNRSVEKPDRRISNTTGLLVNRNSIPIWYQKRFLRPILINFYFEKWMEFINKSILWEGCLCQYYVLTIDYKS